MIGAKAGWWRQAAAAIMVAVIPLILGGCAPVRQPRQRGGRTGPAIDMSKRPMTPDGPLRGIALGKTMADGRLLKAGPKFSTEDTKVVAVIGLGNDVPPDTPLTVAWYKTSGFNEDEFLFEHTIRVGSEGVGVSEGVSPRGLAPGRYQTVAFMGEHQVRIFWVVRDQGSTQAATRKPASLSAIQRGLLPGLEVAESGSSESDDWDTPRPGNSWWDQPEKPNEAEQSPEPPGPCKVVSISPNTTPMTEIRAHATGTRSCKRLQLDVSVASGPKSTLAAADFDSDATRYWTQIEGEADVCELPSGSDFPGTLLTYNAEGSEGATATEVYELENLGESLMTVPYSNPKPASKVSPGDKIDLRADAIVFPFSFGIKSQSLYVNGVLAGSAGNYSGTTEATPCDMGRYGAELVMLDGYTVPANPPPVIEICSEVIGFDGLTDRDCIWLFTGEEVWQGKSTGFVSRPHCEPSKVGMDPGDVFLTVLADKTVAGVATEAWDGCVAPGPTEVPPVSYTYQISGRKTETSFELTIVGTGSRQMSIPITGKNAAATITEGSGGDSMEVTYNLSCVTCP